MTVILDGWHGEPAACTRLARCQRRAERLIEVTYEAMMRGIAVMSRAPPPATSALRSRPMSKRSTCAWCATSAAMGLGELFHDEPNIVHFGRPGEGVALQPGMFFTVEPMINLGRPQ